MPFVKEGTLDCEYSDFCDKKITDRLDKRQNSKL